MEITLRQVVKNAIYVLNRLSKKIERAYDETWGIEELTEEFVNELEERKEYNKEKTIEIIAKDIAMKIYNKHKISLNERQAKRVAEALFEKAKKDGAIDELNNIIE